MRFIMFIFSFFFNFFWRCGQRVLSILYEFDWLLLLLLLFSFRQSSSADQFWGRPL